MKKQKTVAQMVRDFSGVDLHDMDITCKVTQGSDSPKSKGKPQVSKPGGLKLAKAKNSNGAGAMAFANGKKN